MSHRMLKRGVYLYLTLTLFIATTSVKATAQETLPNLIKRVKAAVVLITTFDEKGKPLQQGSGFFVEQNRLITNFHVIDGASRSQIKTFDGNIYPVQGVVGVNKKRDLALLFVNVSPSRSWALEVEESPPREGEEIIVVHNPVGSSWKVSKGRTSHIWDFQVIGELISITASLAPGSSGGPVVNLQGRVIGIATMHVDAADDLNFAVPSELITALRHDTRSFSGTIGRLNVPGK